MDEHKEEEWRQKPQDQEGRRAVTAIRRRRPSQCRRGARQSEHGQWQREQQQCPPERSRHEHEVHFERAPRVRTDPGETGELTDRPADVLDRSVGEQCRWDEPQQAAHRERDRG